MRRAFTPGPWVEHRDSDWSVETVSSNAYKHVGPKGADPVAIVVVAHWSAMDDVLDANARLIAAAPELLAALEALTAEAHRNMIGGKGHLIDDARAAIAKAKRAVS